MPDAQRPQSALALMAILMLVGCSNPKDDKPVDTTLPGEPVNNTIVNDIEQNSELEPVVENSLVDQAASPEADGQDWAQLTPLPPDTNDDGTCARPILRAQTRSLDGGFIYQRICRWTTSDDIVQVRVADGERTEVGPGNTLAVIRNGPYRGYLLLQRHKYLPEGGSYDATYVVRPDGFETLKVPDSDAGDSDVVQLWLEQHGWAAS